MNKKKLCSLCGIKKSIKTGFYRNASKKDGLQTVCKVCSKKTATKRRQDSEWYPYHTERNRVWRAKHPEKYKAHTKVNNALADKRLHRQPCEICGASRVQAHHDDYSKPLEVRWLCQAHHNR